MSAPEAKEKEGGGAKVEGQQGFVDRCRQMMSGWMPDCCGPEMRAMMSRWMTGLQAEAKK